MIPLFGNFTRALRAGVSGDVQVRVIKRKRTGGRRAKRRCAGGAGAAKIRFEGDHIMKVHNKRNGAERYVYKRTTKIHALLRGQIVKHGWTHRRHTSRNDGGTRYDTFRREGEHSAQEQLSLL